MFAATVRTAVAAPSPPPPAPSSPPPPFPPANAQIAAAERASGPATCDAAGEIRRRAARDELTRDRASVVRYDPANATPDLCGSRRPACGSAAAASNAFGPDDSNASNGFSNVSNASSALAARDVVFVLDASAAVGGDAFRRASLEALLTQFCASHDGAKHRAGVILYPAPAGQSRGSCGAYQVAVPLARYTTEEWFDKVDGLRARTLEGGDLNFDDASTRREYAPLAEALDGARVELETAGEAAAGSSSSSPRDKLVVIVSAGVPTPAMRDEACGEGASDKAVSMTRDWPFRRAWSDGGVVNACTYAWKYVPAAAQRLKMVEGVRIAAVNVAGGRTTARGADETSSSSAEDEEDASSSFFGGGGAVVSARESTFGSAGAAFLQGAPWPGACDADGTCAIAAQYGGELGRWVYDGPEEGEEAEEEEEEEEESSASSSSSSSLGSDARPRRAAGLGRRPLRGGARSSLPVPASVAKSLKGRPLTTAEAREVVDALARRRSLASLGARPRDGGSDFVGSDFVESDDASSAASSSSSSSPPSAVDLSLIFRYVPGERKTCEWSLHPKEEDSSDSSNGPSNGRQIVSSPVSAHLVTARSAFGGDAATASEAYPSDVAGAHGRVTGAEGGTDARLNAFHGGDGAVRGDASRESATDAVASVMCEAPEEGGAAGASSAGVCASDVADAPGAAAAAQCAATDAASSREDAAECLRGLVYAFCADVGEAAEAEASGDARTPPSSSSSSCFYDGRLLEAASVPEEAPRNAFWGAFACNRVCAVDQSEGSSTAASGSSTAASGSSTAVEATTRVEAEVRCLPGSARCELGAIRRFAAGEAADARRRDPEGIRAEVWASEDFLGANRGAVLEEAPAHVTADSLHGWGVNPYLRGGGRR